MSRCFSVSSFTAVLSFHVANTLYHYSVVPKDMSADPKNFNCRRAGEVIVIVRSLSKGNESCAAFHLRLYLRLYGFRLRRRDVSSRNS